MSTNHAVYLAIVYYIVGIAIYRINELKEKAYKSATIARLA